MHDGPSPAARSAPPTRTHNTPRPNRRLTVAKPQTHRRGDGDSPSRKRRLAVTETGTHRHGNGDSPSQERRLAVTETETRLGGGRALVPADGLPQPQPVAPLRLAGDGVQRTRPPRPRARGGAAARTPAEPVGLVRDQQPAPHLGHARHHVGDRLVVPLRRSVHETCSPSDPPRRRAAAGPDGVPVGGGDGPAAATYRARPLTLRAPPAGAPRG